MMNKKLVNFLAIVVTMIYCSHLICSVVVLTTIETLPSWLALLPLLNPTLALAVFSFFDKIGWLGGENNE